MKAIEGFHGEYRFLSNFWPAEVTFEEMVFPSTEHAYQAAKTLDRAARAKIAALSTAGEAKSAGRELTLREGWDGLKLTVMCDLLRQKFKHPALRASLIATYPHPLIESNSWGDRWWGVCKGTGLNHLGLLLMQVRAECMAEAAKTSPQEPASRPFTGIRIGAPKTNVGAEFVAVLGLGDVPVAGLGDSPEEAMLGALDLLFVRLREMTTQALAYKSADPAALNRTLKLLTRWSAELRDEHKHELVATEHIRFVRASLDGDTPPSIAKLTLDDVGDDFI